YVSSVSLFVTRSLPILPSFLCTPLPLRDLAPPRMRTIVALLLRCASPAAQLPRALMMKPLTYRTTAPSLRAPRRHRRPTTITRTHMPVRPPIASAVHSAPAPHSRRLLLPLLAPPPSSSRLQMSGGKPDRQSEHHPCLLIRCPRARLLTLEGNPHPSPNTTSAPSRRLLAFDTHVIAARPNAADIAPRHTDTHRAHVRRRRHRWP
ncbi:hypothetical protein B0H14DRAFT_3663489, partial [Mycena olivaceomarginata]